MVFRTFNKNTVSDGEELCRSAGVVFQHFDGNIRVWFERATEETAVFNARELLNAFHRVVNDNHSEHRLHTVNGVEYAVKRYVCLEQTGTHYDATCFHSLGMVEEDMREMVDEYRGKL